MAGGKRAGSGRKRKPTAAHKADGTYREHEHGGRSEPRFDRPSFNPPTQLDAAAKQEWKRLAPKLYKLGLFTMADKAVFSVYCQAWSDWVRITGELNALNTITFTTSNGYQGISPLVGARVKAWGMLKEAATRFGLDPSSRASLDVPPLPEGETAEDFFYGTPKLVGDADA